MEGPPSGWYVFGTHAGWDSEHIPLLEFSEEVDEAGLPLWERPTNVDLIYPGELHHGLKAVKQRLIRSFADHVDGLADTIIFGRPVDRVAQEPHPADLLSRDPKRPTVARIEIDDDFVAYGPFYNDGRNIVRVMNVLDPDDNNSVVCSIGSVRKVEVFCHAS